MEAKEKLENVNWIERINAASNINTPAETLTELAKDKVSEVRSNAAINPNTPTETLVKLAKDENIIVRRCVASNPNTLAETLAELAKDEDYEVRKRAASNINTPAETLSELAKDENLDIRIIVADNPNTSAETLKNLVEKWNDDLIPCYEDIAENIYSDSGKSLLSYDFDLPFGQIKRITYEIIDNEVETVTIKYMERFRGEDGCKTVDDEDICLFYIDKANEYITAYLEKMIPIWDKENEEWNKQLDIMCTSPIYR